MNTAEIAPTLASLPAFVNEPFLDFAHGDVKRAMEAALEKVAGELGREYDLVIGGKRVRTAETIVSVNPARPAQVVGIHQMAEAEHAEPAMQAALAAFESWSRTPVSERVGLLLRVSKLIQERKFELCAWLTFEVGKNWAEADADVGECIDFMEFYAREALKLDGATTPIQLPGEINRLRYLPLGVGAVISPWNFPFAIMAGMTAAAIVCGNTVVLKPSIDAPTIAAKFFALLEEAGMPDGVVNFCPGGGPGFGSAVVAHPQTRFIAFTGSKKVGLEIHESAAKTQPGQRFIKRTILELGGKDAIIVDRNCDLDAAVEGGDQRLRLQWAEVLGVLARDCGCGHLRHLLRAAGGARGEDPAGRPSGERLHGPGHQPDRIQAGAGLH
jgi:1-pyrroline-5-carboxylate dehydrogenase